MSQPAPFRCRPWAGALVLALLSSGGCRYLDARLDDLGDCFVYRWHQGALGVSALAKVGPAELCVGGWYADWGWGKDSWWQRPGYVLTNHGTGVPFTTLGPLGYGQSFSRLLATSTSGNHPGDPNAFDDVHSWILVSDIFDLDDSSPFRLSTAQRISDTFGIEVGVVPVLCSLHVGFNVAEFADLLLGFGLIDVFGDDGRVRPPTVPVVPAGG